MRKLSLVLGFALVGALASTNLAAQTASQKASPQKASPKAVGNEPALGPDGRPLDETKLGEFVVTGVVQEHVPKIAVLPSLSPALEDVVVRSVVRRDLELTGLFDVIPDQKAPPGLYGFEDSVDVDAWKKVGAEAIVKVAARDVKGSDQIEVFGLAYFLDVGEDPVYEKKIKVSKDEARVTAHRITDALLGALTGRPGGFASRFTYSGRWGRNRRIFTADADGHGLTPRTEEKVTAIAPTWGPGNDLFYAASRNYSPFRLEKLDLTPSPTTRSNRSTPARKASPKPTADKGAKTVVATPAGPEAQRVSLPFSTSVYSVAFSPDNERMAVAVAERGGSSIYVGNADGSDMKKVSQTLLATHPVFSPSGKLAWIGGEPSKSAQRVYVDGKPVSPAGFTAAAPAFCDTEDGIRLVYAVAVGGHRQDLVMSGETGGGIVRLTQNQGTNSYPACSPDGRMLAFFSSRKSGDGLYMMSLKRFRTLKVMGQVGESLRWSPLPPPLAGKDVD